MSIPAHCENVRTIILLYLIKFQNSLLIKEIELLLMIIPVLVLLVFTCEETPCVLIRDTFEIRDSFSKSDNVEGSHKEKRFQSYKRYVKLICDN